MSGVLGLSAQAPAGRHRRRPRRPQLAGQLDTIRDPGRASRLATTTHRECRRIPHTARGTHDAALAQDAEIVPDDHAPAAEQELLTAEHYAALRETFAHLSPCCQQLITLLTQNPPISYVQISTRLSTISADLQTPGVSTRAGLNVTGRQRHSVRARSRPQFRHTGVH
jgi:hypothetical protein